jgi:hypothetical protein
MELGSRERASQDSLKHVLKRRLPDLDRDDHRRYIEIECHRIVETLRSIRDVYRLYLEEKGCKPIAEMYWVVFRFGILQYAVRLLREIAFEYVFSTKVPFEEWEVLYGRCFARTLPIVVHSSLPESPETPTPDSVKDVIRGLIRQETFKHILAGGPFGRNGQTYLAKRYPSFDFWGPGVDFLQVVKHRQALWTKCKPWTAGLAQLFDTTQEELSFEYSLLADDAKRVESAFIELSAFEKIAHEYLIDVRRRSVNSRNLAPSDWLGILDALDRKEIALDSELTGTPKRVLEAVRRRGHQILTWTACYQYRAIVHLENGRTYSLRREVTHAVHNAAKRAAYQLAKVWSLKR